MVQTPGNVNSKDTVLGGEVLSFEVNVGIINANLGSIPIFVVPAGENYRVLSLRTVCTIVAAGSVVATLKLTDGAADVTTAVAHAGAAIGAVLTPAILTAADVDKLSAGDTLTIVTAAGGGTATAGEFYVRIDLVRVTNNM